YGRGRALGSAGGFRANRMAVARRSCFLQFRVWTAHHGKIRGARPRIQFAQEGVVALLGSQLSHTARRIIGVAEDDGLRRAGLLASRDDGAIANRLVLFFRFDAHIGDALHAIRALFHDATAAHGYFRIAQQFELRRFPILEAKAIESAHFVWSLVRTIPRPDAPVIGHI